MGRPARLIRSPAAPGAVNMAADEALLRACAAGEAPPTLRFYAWDPPAVSLGYFQPLDRAVDREACRELGIDVVRRPTGGRALLHHLEVTYCLVVPRALLPDSVVESHRRISAGLARGLRRLGVEAVLAAGTRRVRPAVAGSAACFDAPGAYEVTVRGRKLVGSAQVRQGDAVLEHGSILLSFVPELHARVLRGLPGEGHQRGEFLRRQVIALDEILGRRVTATEVQQAVAEGLAAELGLDWEEGEMTPAERALAAGLERDKYGHPAWTERR
ncbi:MAG TPA: biotin/lipoate A/B protein ligase family protein [Thermaerobacter sp.]